MRQVNNTCTCTTGLGSNGLSSKILAVFLTTIAITLGGCSARGILPGSGVSSTTSWIDETAGNPDRLTLTTDNNPYDITPDTEIMIENKPGTFSQLKSGMKVRLRFREDGRRRTVFFISAETPFVTLPHQSIKSRPGRQTTLKPQGIHADETDQETESGTKLVVYGDIVACDKNMGQLWLSTEGEFPAKKITLTDNTRIMLNAIPALPEHISPGLYATAKFDHEGNLLALKLDGSGYEYYATIKSFDRAAQTLKVTSLSGEEIPVTLTSKTMVFHNGEQKNVTASSSAFQNGKSVIIHPRPMPGQQFIATQIEFYSEPWKEEQRGVITAVNSSRSTISVLSTSGQQLELRYGTDSKIVDTSGNNLSFRQLLPGLKIDCTFLMGSSDPKPFRRVVVRNNTARLSLSCTLHTVDFARKSITAISDYGETITFSYNENTSFREGSTNGTIPAELLQPGALLQVIMELNTQGVFNALGIEVFLDGFTTVFANGNNPTIDKNLLYYTDIYGIPRNHPLSDHCKWVTNNRQHIEPGVIPPLSTVKIKLRKTESGWVITRVDVFN